MTALRSSPAFTASISLYCSALLLVLTTRLDYSSLLLVFTSAAAMLKKVMAALRSSPLLVKTSSVCVCERERGMREGEGQRGCALRAELNERAREREREREREMREGEGHKGCALRAERESARARERERK